MAATTAATGATTMSRLPRIAAGLAALALVFPTGAPASAVAPAFQEQPVEQATFGVRPATATEPDNRARFTYGATPGAVVRDHLAVSNVGTGPLTLRVYASDAFNTPEGGFDLLAAGRAPTDVGAWIRADQDTVAVAARSVAIVAFTLTVPADATPGDHVGGIVASLATERVGADGAKVAVEQRVGARIYLRVSGELRPQLSVEGLTTTYHHTPNPIGRGRATVSYTVRNAGNVRLQGTQRVSVRLPWGSTVDAGQLPPLPELLPGNAFAVTAEVPAVFPAGWLTGRVELEPGSLPGDQNPPLPGSTGSATTSALPWALLALIAVVVALLLLARWRRRHRDRLAATPTPPPVTPAATAPAPVVPASSDPAPAPAPRTEETVHAAP